MSLVLVMEKSYLKFYCREEIACAEDLGVYYRVPPDLRDLNHRKFVDQGEEDISQAEDYNSHNTDRLDVDAMKALLRKLDFIQALERGEHIPPEE